MKRKIVLFFLIITALALCSCGKGGESAPEDGPQIGSCQVTWDAVTYNTHDEFTQALGIEISAPNEATGDTYIIISKQLGEILYDCGDHSWTYRASKTNTGYELYGIDEINFTSESTSVEIAGVSFGIMFTNDGGTLAHWSKGGVNYSLFTESTLTAEEMKTELLGIGY